MPTTRWEPYPIDKRTIIIMAGCKTGHYFFIAQTVLRYCQNETAESAF